MHILFLTDNYPPEVNAPASRTFEHCREWVRQGHQVTVITGAPNFPAGRVFSGYRNAWRKVSVEDGIRVVRVKTYITANEGFLKRTLDYLSFMLSATLMSFFERRPDVVVATSPQFFTAIAGWVVSITKHRPFVFEVRDLWPATIEAVGALRPGIVLSGLYRLEHFLYQRADAVVLVTEAFRRNLLHRGVDPEKLSVVRNGVDPAAFSPVERDQQLAGEHNLANCFVVGYLGTHGVCHALDSVLDAADRLAHRKDIVFLFVGAGAGRAAVEGRVRQNGMTNVRLVPAQPREHMPVYYGLCDVSLVPLKDDPVFSTVIPSKIFECMAMGLPMLVSIPAGETTDIIDNTKAGLVVSPEDDEVLAETIEYLSDHPAELFELSCASSSAALDFSRPRQARVMLDVFEGAIARKNRGGDL